MSTNETVSLAASLLFEGEVVAIVRGVEIFETAVGFEIESEWDGAAVYFDMPAAVSAAKFEAAGREACRKLCDDLEEIAANCFIVIGADDCVIRRIDTMPAA